MEEARSTSNPAWRRLFVGRENEHRWLVDAWRQAKRPTVSHLAGRERAGQDAARVGVLSLVVEKRGPAF